MQNSIYVGLDVHKSSITVAVAESGRRGDVRHWGAISNRPRDREAVRFGQIASLFFRPALAFWCADLGEDIHEAAVVDGRACVTVGVVGA